MTYLGTLKTTRIGFGIGYGHMPYTSVVESAGIGTAYASVFKSAGIGLLNESAGIGLLNFIHSRPTQRF